MLLYFFKEGGSTYYGVVSGSPCRALGWLPRSRTKQPRRGGRKQGKGARSVTRVAESAGTACLTSRSTRRPSPDGEMETAASLVRVQRTLNKTESRGVGLTRLHCTYTKWSVFMSTVTWRATHKLGVSLRKTFWIKQFKVNKAKQIVSAGPG